ncbi:MAG: urea transporter [Bacteroidales bacterium]|jgi:urea transporter|nr:urea transporter [Bacteroidales bacterium]
MSKNVSGNSGSKQFSNNYPFINQVFKGLGQIMLQENIITGLLFLAGIFYGSVFMGFAALLATICGTITAYLFGFDKTNTDKGLYGFSAALTGVAFILFFGYSFIIWVLIVVGSVLAALIQEFFIRRKITVFTLPFVLVTWVALVGVKSISPELLVKSSSSVTIANDYFTYAIKGFGQVIFQNKAVSGILFFIAVLIHSPIAALYGLAAAIFSGIISLNFNIPVENISEGLLSFNAVLTAIAFAGNKLKDAVWISVAVLLSLVISLYMMQNGYIQLTFPFVAASVITLAIKRLLHAK